MCKLPNETVVLCKQANEIVVCQLPVSFCLGFTLQPFFWSFWTQPPVTPSAALLKPLNNHYGEFWKADVSALPFGCTEKLLIQCQSNLRLHLICFSLLCSVIGPENSHEALHQSDVELKPISTWSPEFSNLRQFGCFYSKISLALKGTFLSSNWPLQLL